MVAKFQDQVVHITGEANGIGRATTLRLAALGASLATCDVNTPMLSDTEALLPKDTPILLKKSMSPPSQTSPPLSMLSSASSDA